MEEEEENEEKTSTKFAQSIVEHVNRADIEAMVQVQREYSRHIGYIQYSGCI
jgi:hypothetical protein